MTTKKLLISLIVTLFGISLISSSALAGSKQRYRWEGVAIGVGAAILGHAIYQAHRAADQPRVVYVEPPPPPAYRYRHGPKHHRGHWELQKTWVPPTYQRAWNPGHYDRRGNWVPGAWIELKTSDGYWRQERIWVADNHRPYR
jgi:hypothetical protein